MLFPVEILTPRCSTLFLLERVTFLLVGIDADATVFGFAAYDFASKFAISFVELVGVIDAVDVANLGDVVGVTVVVVVTCVVVFSTLV